MSMTKILQPDRSCANVKMIYITLSIMNSQFLMCYILNTFLDYEIYDDYWHWLIISVNLDPLVNTVFSFIEVLIKGFYASEYWFAQHSKFAICSIFLFNIWTLIKLLRSNNWSFTWKGYVEGIKLVCLLKYLLWSSMHLKIHLLNIEVWDLTNFESTFEPWWSW